MDAHKTRVDGGSPEPHPLAVLRDLNARLVAFARERDLSGSSLAELLDILDQAVGIGPEGATGRPPAPEREVPRYELKEPLAEGGMGAVWRVHDPALDRTLAMKVLLPEHARRRDLVAAFLNEARLVASLDHPSIVPIYSVGRLPPPDGRPYFTMREVRGRTFSALIEATHAAGPASDGRQLVPLRRLVRVFQAVCGAVAFAHRRGLLHRDLKPGNVMVGELGEVYVMDWGLARLKGQLSLVGELPGVEAPPGAVQGTLPYLAPEVARGDADATVATDIYALGAILYQALSGRPPYTGPYEAVRRQLLDGPPEPVQSCFPVPGDLLGICRRAMARDPHERYADAVELSHDVEAWLEGARRLEEARRLVKDAEGTQGRVAALAAKGAALQQRAAELLRGVPPHAPERDKIPGWRLQDEAEALERQARLKEVEALQLLRGALIRVPDYLPAHRRLARYFRAEHAAAEDRGDRSAAARFEVLLRNHDRDGAHAAYLAGRGRLSLRTSEPVKVELHRYVTRNRRLVAEYCGSLGATPLQGRELQRGSYLAVLHAADGRAVRYPFRLGRQEHWPRPRPGGDADTAEIPIPPDLGPDRVYVPAGWFRSGGDRRAYGAPLAAAEVWVDGFFMDRFPVTNRDYIVFLDDLVAAGREAEALRWAPRERGGPGNEDGALIYGRGGDGRFCLQADADGDRWLPDWPVLMVPHEAALAYARWRSERDGLPWRLPWEIEWEKAARGVDGRLFPWGSALDPTWCCMRESSPGRSQPAVVDSYPVDSSPYGIRGLAGNTYDWCADDYTDEGPVLADGRWQATADRGALRVVRGGSWDSAEGKCRSAYRSSARSDTRSALLGFRLACSVPMIGP